MKPSLRTTLWSALLLSLCLLLFPAVVSADEHGVPEETLQRVRPRAIALSPGKQGLITANRIAGTVSVLSVPEMQVETQIPVGQEPADVVWLNDREWIVALHRDRRLKRFVRQEDTWNLTQTVPLAGCPVQIHFLTSTGKLLVTEQHPDAIVEYDLTAGLPTRSFPCGNLPRYLTVSADEKWFAATCELPGEIWCFDLQTGMVLSRQEIHNTAFNLGQPVLISDHELVVSTTINRDFPVTAENMARGWVVNNRIVKLQVPAGAALEQRHMNLDQRGHGAADLTGVFYDAARDSLIVLAGGVHEMLFLDLQKISWPAGDPDDYAPHHLREQPGALQRLNVGGRPMDLVFLNRQEVMVANELEDALQKVDLNFHQITNRVKLSDSDHQSLIAEGERLFYDGLRSKDGWLSCHTCHYDGHTSGQVFDTLNDGSYDTKKLTLSLQLVSETEPWTWHGWQPDLTESMEKSLRDTMHGSQPVTRHAANALTAYTETLRPVSPVDSGTVSPTARQRGRDLFFGSAGCATCHELPYLTSNLRYAVGRVETESIFDVYNPPVLLGVSTRRRFLHHGSAHSLEQVLKLYHRPEQTSGAILSAEEIEDLVVFLQGL